MSGGDWVIAGKPKGTMPIVGGLYEIRNERKGKFVGKVVDISDEWLTVEIVDGIAKAIMYYNVKGNGEQVTVRDTHTYLIEIQP